MSHDYRKRDSAGLWDYSEHFDRINRLCDNEGCDTVLYALYTWDKRSAVPGPSPAMFDRMRHVLRVVIETGDFTGGSPSLDKLSVQVWARGVASPLIVRQRFATSQDAVGSGKLLIGELAGRRVADGMVLICGETNIASLVRKTRRMYDPHQINQRLCDLGVQVILNPIHDYMRRYEMKEKRRYYSTGSRWVVSVWNQGKGKESASPWTVFHDGAEAASRVRELPRPFAERPDIRIGVLDIA